MTSYTIDMQVLLKLLAFIDFDRPEFAAIHVEKGRMWATDGKIMVGHRVNVGSKDDKFDIPISRELTENLKWVNPSTVTATYMPSVGHLTVDGKTLYLGLYDDIYPDYRQVFPKPKSLKPITCLRVNTKYLYRLGLVDGDESAHLIEIYGTGSVTDMFVVLPISRKWIAIVMPLRPPLNEIKTVQVALAELQEK